MRHEKSADISERLSRTYQTLRSMRYRCAAPRHKSFHLYGGRGITVCDRWKNSFENFLADMGERPEGMTIDRSDVKGNYEPNNCKWATAVEQCRTRRQPESVKGSLIARGQVYLPG